MATVGLLIVKNGSSSGGYAIVVVAILALAVGAGVMLRLSKRA